MAISDLTVPGPGASSVELRLAPLAGALNDSPGSWRHAPLTGPRGSGWWDIDLRTLNLADGAYAYEFVVHRGAGSFVVADPYAEELAHLSGCRPILRIHEGERVRPHFSWDHELPPSGSLPDNNQLVICELPMRWAAPGSSHPPRTGHATSETLAEVLAGLHVNCIEMLPVQDSPDTLNGGYGTRFFFAPDLDIGTPLDLRAFIKRCHQRGIRVLMDLVMNHARESPLRDLAFDWFFLRNGRDEPQPDGDPRPDWGGDIFRYRRECGGAFHARNLHYDIASFFITEYHIDGFRLDEFKGIDNYEFIQAFTDHAHAAHCRHFLGRRPFIVIAEDSWRRARVTSKGGYHGRRVVDAIWDFNFRDDGRKLVSDSIRTEFGETSRSNRVRRLLTVARPDLFAAEERECRCFRDMAHRVTYITSHDAQAGEEHRLMPYFLARLAGGQRLSLDQADRLGLAREMVHSAFALTLTAAGIPMFLAGEETGSHEPPNPADEQPPAPEGLPRRIGELIRTRTTHPALHRNEVEFFGFSRGTARQGFHPDFDENGGERLFAYCRTGGEPLGSAGQVIVVANCSPRDYPVLDLDWPWGVQPNLNEAGGSGQEIPIVTGHRARLALRPFQVRVFTV